MTRTSLIIVLAIIFVAAFSVPAQQKPRPKEVLLDFNGNPISNDEFRDYSLSDPQRKKSFTRTVLPDGTVELRLIKNLIEGNAMPSFTAKTIDGRTLDLDDKVVVLNFWFIGCPGCREEIPKLNELAAKYVGKPDVIFLALSIDPAASITDFIHKVPFTYLHSADARNTADLFGVKTFPRNVVIGRDGKIAYWRSTVKAWEQFDAVVEAELEKP